MVAIKRMDKFPFARYAPSNDGTGELLEYPYEKLGILRSHVYPHFAIVNAAPKIARDAEFCGNISRIVAMRTSLTVTQVEELVVRLMNMWDGWTTHTGNNDSSSGEDGTYQDGTDRGCEEKSEGSNGNPLLRSLRCSPKDIEFVDNGGGCTSWDTGENHREVESNQGDTNDVHRPRLAVSALPVIADDKEYEEHICQWADEVRIATLRSQSTEHASQAEWRICQVCVDVACAGDKHVNLALEFHRAAEVARPPRKEPWHTWYPAWVRRDARDMHKPPPDTKAFSSNDWAMYDCCYILTSRIDS
jgi:hypothetical protein